MENLAALRKLLGVPEAVRDEELKFWFYEYLPDGEPACGREGCEMCGFNEGEPHITFSLRWYVGPEAETAPISWDNHRDKTWYGEDRWEQFYAALRSV